MASKSPSRIWALVSMAAVAAAIAGCASHPKPEEPTPSAPPPPPPPSSYAAPPQAPVQSGPLPGTAQDFVVNVGDRVYFDYDQYTVRQDAVGVLTSQAEWLNRYPAVHVRIEGNTDDRGTEEYNLALGARRAEAVKTFLIQHTVDPSRITTISYGKERPMDPGTGEEAWSHNRNVQTAIISGAK